MSVIREIMEVLQEIPRLTEVVGVLKGLHHWILEEIFGDLEEVPNHTRVQVSMERVVL